MQAFIKYFLLFLYITRKFHFFAYNIIEGFLNVIKVVTGNIVRDKPINHAFREADFQKFTQTNWEANYEDYLIALKKIRKYKRWVQSEIKELNGSIYNGRKIGIDKETQEFRRMVFSAEEDLVYEIKMIEKYLPYEKRYFIKQENKKYVLNILDKDYKNLIKISDNYIENLIINDEYKNIIYELIELILTEQQFKCIKLYYGEYNTQEEIAKKLGISQQGVQNHLQKAMARMKDNITKFNNLYF